MSVHTAKPAGRRKVLIVAYLFPPIGGIGTQRALKFSQLLGQHGWDPLVLTVADGVSATMDDTLLADIPAEVKVVRVRDPLSRFVRQAIQTHDLPDGADEAAPPSVLRKILKAMKNALCLPDEQIVWA